MTSSGSNSGQDEQAQETQRKTTNFSIDHILNKAGANQPSCSVDFTSLLRPEENPSLPYTWLHCTRYCPPKVPRKREGPQKRQLGRHPRIPFTSHQLAILEERFQKSPYLSSEEVTKLSSVLQLADIRVKIWFQNRRARERRERQQTLEMEKPHTETHADIWSPSCSQILLAPTENSRSPPVSYLQSTSYQDPNLMLKFVIKEEND